MPEENSEKIEASEFVSISVSLPFSLLAEYDRQAKMRGFKRSEAIRASMREQLSVWLGRRY